jgi:hypothetical protein
MENDINYKAIFVVGFVFMSSGIAISIAAGPAGIGLLGVGLVFITIGLANRDKWPNDNG